MGAEIPISDLEIKQIHTPVLWGKKNHSKLSQPLIWLLFTPLLIYAAVFLLYINLRWTPTVQQKIYYLESVKWNSVQEVKQVKIQG